MKKGLQLTGPQRSARWKDHAETWTCPECGAVRKKPGQHVGSIRCTMTTKARELEAQGWRRPRDLLVAGLPWVRSRLFQTKDTATGMRCEPWVDPQTVETVERLKASGATRAEIRATLTLLPEPMEGTAWREA